MEEQVRDNEAWDLLLFAVVYELAPDNLGQRSKALLDVEDSLYYAYFNTVMLSASIYAL